jgi:hypothetical protein
MKLKYAKNPKWVNRSKTFIDLIVRFEEINEDLPFTANPQDVVEHGRDIFARAVAGEFGAIAEFDPVEPTIEDVSQAVRAERDKKLSETDWTQGADVPQSTKDKWAEYRQALRDMPQQVGFPWKDQVVVEVDSGFFIDVTNAPFPVKP